MAKGKKKTVMRQSRYGEGSQQRTHCIVYRGLGVRKTWHILVKTSHVIQLQYRWVGEQGPDEKG